MKVPRPAAVEVAPTTIAHHALGVERLVAAESPPIVLVDDDTDTRELVAELLEDEGYAVTTAQNGADALSKLTESPMPRLIILDLNMPELNGAEFAHQLLLEPTFGRVPVLVVSGSPTGRQQAALLGADAFLEKPVQPADLLEQVSYLLEQG